MTSDGILEKELRERFGVDSIVSHLDGNVVVTLKPEAFDHLLSYDHHDECYPYDEHVGEVGTAEDVGWEKGHSEGYADAIADVEELADAKYQEAYDEGHQVGYDLALKDARVAGWNPTAVTS